MPHNKKIHCWWCCHVSSEKLFNMPFDFIYGKYQSFGYFCSFSCMKAYNLKENDTFVTKRLALINQLLRECNDKDITHNIAPPRECLKIFGGTMSIDDFRGNFNQDFTYKIQDKYINVIDSNIEKQSHFRWLTSNDLSKNINKQEPIDISTNININNSSNKGEKKLNPIKIKSKKKDVHTTNFTRLDSVLSLITKSSKSIEE